MGHFVRCTQLLGSALVVFVLKFVAGNGLRILLVLLSGLFKDIANVSISRQQVRVGLDTGLFFSGSGRVLDLRVRVGSGLKVRVRVGPPFFGLWA